MVSIKTKTNTSKPSRCWRNVRHFFWTGHIGRLDWSNCSSLHMASSHTLPSTGSPSMDQDRYCCCGKLSCLFGGWTRLVWCDWSLKYITNPRKLAVVDTLMNMGFTKHVVNFLTSRLALSFSKHTMFHIRVEGEIFRTCADRNLGFAQLPVQWVPGLYRR